MAYFASGGPANFKPRAGAWLDSHEIRNLPWPRHLQCKQNATHQLLKHPLLQRNQLALQKSRVIAGTACHPEEP